jgi:hypothetical protein
MIATRRTTNSKRTNTTRIVLTRSLARLLAMTSCLDEAHFTPDKIIKIITSRPKNGAIKNIALRSLHKIAPKDPLESPSAEARLTKRKNRIKADIFFI